MGETNKKGDIAEYAVMLHAARKGYYAAKMPQDCPYDLVIDRGNGPERVQVKYRTVTKQGSVSIRIQNGSFTNRRTYTEKDLDWFAVYNPDSDTVYLIPSSVCKDAAEITLRLEPAKNKQTKKVRLLSDYKDW